MLRAIMRQHRYIISAAAAATVAHASAGSWRWGFCSGNEKKDGQASVRPPTKPPLPLSVNTTSQTLTYEVLSKAVAEAKEASRQIGDVPIGLGLMVLVAREVLKGDEAYKARLSEDLVSPPISRVRARALADAVLEYAKLCYAVYEINEDRQWTELEKENGRHYQLLHSHKGGLYIPRHVLLRDDTAEEPNSQRKNRLMVVVRGTADVTDAVVDIAMTPGLYKYLGKDYYSHKGIVEASQFLISVVRPAIFRALDDMRKQGIDPSESVEIVLTGHSLGAATAAIAALELQNEFGSEVPVRSVGFATPASLSDKLATATSTRRIVKTFVFGDDIIPRCSTKNLKELRQKALEVDVEKEMKELGELMKQEFARRGSEYLAALSAIVSLRRSSTAGPTALDSVLNRLGFGTAEKVKAAMEAEAAGKDLSESEKQAWETVLKEYAEAMEAEVQNLRQKIEQVKAGFGLPAFCGGTKCEEERRESVDTSVVQDADEKDEEDKDEETRLSHGLFDHTDDNKDSTKVRRRFTFDLARAQQELEVLLNAQAILANTLRTKLDQTFNVNTGGKPENATGEVKKAPEGSPATEQHESQSGVQEELQAQSKSAFPIKRLHEKLQEKIKEFGESLKEDTEVVKELVEEHLDDLKMMSTEHLEDAKEAVTETLKQVGEKVKELQPRVTRRIKATDLIKAHEGGEEEKKGVQMEVVCQDDVPLYPPGEVWWIRPKTFQEVREGEGGGNTLQYEVRRVRSVKFFDGIILSPTLISDHSLVKYLDALRELREVPAKKGWLHPWIVRT